MTYALFKDVDGNAWRLRRSHHGTILTRTVWPKSPDDAHRVPMTNADVRFFQERGEIELVSLSELTERLTTPAGTVPQYGDEKSIRAAHELHRWLSKQGIGCAAAFASLALERTVRHLRTLTHREREMIRLAAGERSARRIDRQPVQSDLSKLTDAELTAQSIEWFDTGC